MICNYILHCILSHFLSLSRSIPFLVWIDIMWMCGWVVWTPKHIRDQQTQEYQHTIFSDTLLACLVCATTLRRSILAYVCRLSNAITTIENTYTKCTHTQADTHSRGMSLEYRASERRFKRGGDVICGTSINYKTHILTASCLCDIAYILIQDVCHHIDIIYRIMCNIYVHVLFYNVYCMIRVSAC